MKTAIKLTCSTASHTIEVGLTPKGRAYFSDSRQETRIRIGCSVEAYVASLVKAGWTVVS